MSQKTLADLSAGDEGEIRAVAGARAFRRRLLELGFVRGTRLRVVRRLEVGRVVEVELRESRVSLRVAEARVIELDVVDAACTSGGCGPGCGTAGHAAGRPAATGAW